MSLHVKLLNENARLPTRGSDEAAGYDLYATETYTIVPGDRACVATGIALGLPHGCYGRVAPRSGLAVKYGIQVGAGVVDADYTGEIKAVLFNHGHDTFEVKPGDRIAQLVLERYRNVDVYQVETLDDTDRGDGGFGSTGMA